MVYERTDWDPRSFNVDRGVKDADTKTAGVLNATDPDLRAIQGPRRQGYYLPRLERSLDSPVELRPLLQQRRGENGAARNGLLLAAVHGAGNATL